MIWFLGIGMVCMALTGIYVYYRSGKLLKFYKVDIEKKWVRAVRILAALLFAFLCVNIWTTGAVVILHLVVLFLAVDLSAWIIRLVWGKRKSGKLYAGFQTACISGALPLLIFAALLTFGYMNMCSAVRTEYTVTSDKLGQEYRIVFLSDIHYDTIQRPDILKEKVKEINDVHPDVVVLGGDIVEEGTSKASMQEVFQVLGSLESTYGVYYVYGNHDRQPYTDHRTFTNEELEAAMEAGGIHILQDACVELGEELVLAGRDDAAWGNVSGRASVEEILRDADREKFIIVADHQPVEAGENAAQGVDLEVSGHTHAGQIWPVGYLSELTGILNYGEYERDGCKVIVSSGVAGWGYAIRTQEQCEYVVITLRGEK